MLPLLLNVPKDPSEWSQFSLSHRTSHDLIRQRIKQKFGVGLTDYEVDPMNPEDFTGFLQNNAQLHDDMNAVLGLQSSNLQDAQLDDPARLRAWINLHYQEHYDAESRLL